MAKAGEGDPRWIVEERADASNVNNWHWCERDVLPWSKNKMDLLLLNKSDSDQKYLWSITLVSTDGISTIRKGKIKQLFDLELTISFTAELLNDKELSKPIEGKILVPEFSWDSNANDIQFTININSGEKTQQLIDLIKKSFKKFLSEAFLIYKDALEKECTQGLILPTSTKSDQSNFQINSKVGVSSSTIDSFKNQNIKSQSILQNDLNSTSNLQIKLSQTINSTPQNVYDTFLSSEKMMYATHAPAQIDAKVNGNFSYIDGTITGIFTKLDSGNLIEMKWRLRSWQQSHFAIAKLLFTSTNGNSCIFSITHDNVPAHDLERVKCGWERMFLSPIKNIFA